MHRPKVKSPARPELNQLVHSIGGQDVLFSILKEFYEVMSKDVLIGFFFDGRDLDKIAQGQQQFILMAAGFIDKFEGKGPATAHLEMPPILSGHFDRRLVLLREVLQKRNFDSKLVDQWLQFEESFRAVVVSG